MKIPEVVTKLAEEQKLDLEKMVIVLPTKNIGNAMSKFHKVVIEVIEMDITDYYIGRNDTYTHHGAALDRLALASGIQWDPVETGIVLDEQYKSRAKAVGRAINSSGEWIIIPDEDTLEIFPDEVKWINEERAEKGNPVKIVKWEKIRLGKSYPIFAEWKSSDEKEFWIERQTAKDLIDLRRYKNEKAMSGAKLRVIRKLISMKRTWHKEEIFELKEGKPERAKDFLLARVIIDPEKVIQDRALSQQGREMLIQGTRTLYGPVENLRNVTGVNIEPEVEPEVELEIFDEELKVIQDKFLASIRHADVTETYLKRIEKLQTEIIWKDKDKLKEKLVIAKRSFQNLFEIEEEITF